MYSMIRRNPLFPVFSLFEDFARKAQNEETRQAVQNSCPMAMDIYENDKEYSLMANLPGIGKENVKIQFLKNQLSIEAVQTSEKEETEMKFHHRERYCGAYHRTVTIPENADAEKISARMENGVLTVIIPKKAEKAQKAIVID